MVEAEEVFEDAAICFGAALGERMICGEGLACAGIEPDLGPGFVPLGGRPAR